MDISGKLSLTSLLSLRNNTVCHAALFEIGWNTCQAG
jgi:hypothetical protein